MSTVLEPETAAPPGEKRFVLNDVSWKTYQALVEEPGLSGVRMTYDRGALELMSPSPRHERFKSLLGRFIEIYTLELRIPIMTCGSTTYAQEMLERGLEPDESYYVQHEPVVRGRDDLDLDHDPPPDLAIEVEITRSILPKLDVFAALKIPEVWRFDGRTLIALVLDESGDYVERETSLAFPELPLAKLVEFVKRYKTADESSLVAEFQQWVRETFEST